MIPTDVVTACQNPDLLWAFEDAIDGKDLGARVAMEACTGCPVSLPCLEQGRELKAGGVWGGVLLTHSRYRQKGVCERGHALDGPNGRKRIDGTKGCRICETAARLRREARR